MKQRLRTLQYIAALSCIALSGACRQNLIVEMSQGERPGVNLCQQSIRVDVVAVNEESEREQWENMSMSDYWDPGNAQSLRNTVPTYTMRWGDGKCTQTLDGKDDIWQTWKERNSDWLFILADTPGIKDQPANADPRRLSLPLDAKYWKRGLRVTETSIVRRTTKK